MDQYDPMGNYTGYDTYEPVAPVQPVSYDDFGGPVYDPAEEERRRREIEEQIKAYTKQQQELASEVSRKQEITTYADGSHTVKTTHEVPAPGQRQNMETGEMYTPVGAQTRTQPMIQPVAYRPQQPRPVAPVTPASSTYDRMIQAESRGQNFDAEGRPLTSPRGAMFRAQVMPATAANPGFGIRPAQAQTPEEYNRVGAEYYQAMLRKYNGDERLAAAAYNMGPGAVDRNIAQNNGQFNVAQAPRETQRYLAQVFGQQGQPQVAQQRQPQPQVAQQRQPGVVERIVNAIVPSAQAAPMPQRQQGQQLVAGEQGGVPTRPAQLQPVAPATAQVQPQVAPSQYPDDSVINNAVAQFEAASTPAIEPPRMAPNSFDEFGTPVYSQQQADLDSNLKTYENIQNDPRALMNFNSPFEWMNTNARLRAADLMAAQRDDGKAEQRLTQAGPSDLARYIQGKGQKGESNDFVTRVRALMFARMGLQQLAAAEYAKLDTTITDRYVQGSDGKPYLVRQNARGELVGGYNAESGKELTPEEMVKVGAGVMPKGVHVTKTETMTDPDGRTVTKMVLSNGTERFSLGGKPYEGDTSKLVPSRVTEAETKQQYRRENDLNQFARQIASYDYKAKLDAVAKAREAAINRGEADFTDAELAKLGVTRPSLNLFTQTGRVIEPAGTAPAAAPAQGPAAAPTPVVPGPAPAAAPATTTPVPVVPGPAPATTTPAPGTSVLPGRQSVSEGERRKAQEKVDLEVDEARRKEIAKANQTFTDSLTQARRTGVAQRATIDRLQSAITANPDFWGIDTNSATWRAFVDLNSTNEKREEALNTFARNLNIPAERRAAFDQVMNDYRNLQVNAITGSGLTASQTNTERESQRVMGTIGSIADRPAAARATLEYAKAKIDYIEAKNRAWAQARRANPNADYSMFELDFDATQGERIFADANERMNRIINRPPISATQTRPGAGPQAGPAQAPSMTPADRARQELERRRRERGGQ